VTATHVVLSRIRIEGDPFAEGFYLTMGAIRVGETPSRSIPGRSLPLLSVDVDKVPIEVRPVQELAKQVEPLVDAVRSDRRPQVGTLLLEDHGLVVHPGHILLG
jgi:hypothetical protein